MACRSPRDPDRRRSRVVLPDGCVRLQERDAPNASAGTTSITPTQRRCEIVRLGNGSIADGALGAELRP
jgi:hypothetical protein